MAFVSDASVQDRQSIADSQRLTVSLKTLAQMLDAHRSSVRRWLQQAGIRPIVLGKGRSGAIRYKWRDVQEWIESREHTE
jgi:transposase